MHDKFELEKLLLVWRHRGKGLIGKFSKQGASTLVVRTESIGGI